MLSYYHYHTQYQTWSMILFRQFLWTNVPIIIKSTIGEENLVEYGDMDIATLTTKVEQLLGKS